MSEGQAVARLVAIMARLRDPDNGCSWDRAQTFETIAPYTIEEAYEVADAIARADMADLRDELGDLLLQVVFHSRMAEEAGVFALDDVAAAIGDKLERRHPHIFGGGVAIGWETVKEQERRDRGQAGALSGVARALPALHRATKLQARAARVGFDWPDAHGPRAKIDEELGEIAAATTDAAREEEVGDLLFAAVNFARHLRVDPEAALARANSKFEQRFQAMEQRNGGSVDGLNLAEQEALWQAVKRSGA